MHISAVIVIQTSDNGNTNEAICLSDVPPWNNVKGYGTDMNMALNDIIHEIQVKEGDAYHNGVPY